MGKVIILPETTKDPISLIGRCAGVCWGADTSNDEKNYKRGLDCIKSNHGRTLEFPDIYAVLDGYSARVIREWYTHIGGAPTRVQASTRYINYLDFPYYTPEKIAENKGAKSIYDATMNTIRDNCKLLEEKLGIPREDVAMLLPLGMETKMVDKRNVRNVIDMSRQRMCTRAYHEYRKLFNDYISALSDYSEEWKTLVSMTMMPKCEVIGFCTEKKSCGRKPKKESD